MASLGEPVVTEVLAPEGKTMETDAAILWGMGDDWKIETIELDPPKAGEVLVRMAASGMCHSDEHFRTGDLGGLYPIIGGHEGAGRGRGGGARGVATSARATTSCSGSSRPAASAPRAPAATRTSATSGRS